MTSRSALVLLSLAATACHDAPVAPESPPVGLPVTLRMLSSPDAFSGRSPLIVAQGDSVMLTAELSAMNCFDVSTSAGLSNARLVVTITARSPGVLTVCQAIARRGVFRAVVRPAPSGRYTAVLRQRFESDTQAPQEREVVRAPVVIP
jgi:hypothetical protein